MLREFKMKLRIDDVKFYNEDSAFGIYYCVPVPPNYEVMNKYGNVSLQGNTRPLAKGDEVEVVFEGAFQHPVYGDFYKIVQVEPERLNTVSEQDNFLKAILAENHFASLKEAYPDEKLVDLITNDKIDVSKTKGIKDKTMQKIKLKVEKLAGVSMLLSMLSDLNLSTNRVERILKHFNGSAERAIAEIKKNIYNLAEISTFGFTTIDKVALERGDDPESSQRIYACIDYLMRQDGNDGHTWSMKSNILNQAVETLNISGELVYNLLADMSNNDKYYLTDTRIAFSALRKREVDILVHLMRIQKNYVPSKNGNINQILRDVETEQGFLFASEQRETLLNSTDDGVMIINGGGGVGKCVEGSSLVYTEKGLLRIDDINNHFAVNKNEEVEAEIVSYNLKGEKLSKITSHFYDMGYSDTIKIKTAQGYEIEGTLEHPVLVVNKEGELEYKKLGEFDGAEIIPISTNNNLFGKSDKLNEDLSYLLGVIVGDGATGHINLEKGERKSNVNITNSVEEIGEEIVRIVEKEFNIKTNVLRDKNTLRYSFGDKHSADKLVNHLDMPVCLSSEKYVPQSIMTAPKNIVSFFLKGLFDTDGSIYKNVFEYSTASKRLAKEVHALLLNFGIVANLREKIVKGYEQNTYYVITVNSGKYLKEFAQEIGFNKEPEKKRKLDEAVANAKIRNSNINSLIHMNEKIMCVHKYLLDSKIENYNKKNDYKIILKSGESCRIRHARDKRITKNGFRTSVGSEEVLKVVREYPDAPYAEYLKNVTENMFIDRVVSVEESEAHVYDFTVPDTHSFVANGIINHNTTIVKALIETLNANFYHTACLSGKAANVLMKQGLDSSTIHRMLKYSPQDGGFLHNEKNTLPYDVLVLDEFSMNSAELTLAVLEAVESGTKVVIVGDSGQLPSIGNGSADILRDLLATKRFPTYELTQFHRQAAKSGILELANMIRRGEQPMAYGTSGKKVYGEDGDQTLIGYEHKEAIANDIIRISTNYKSKIKRPEDLFGFQIIVSNRERGDLSVRTLNLRIQAIFNDLSKPAISRNGYDYREGDKIISQGNSYKQPTFDDAADYRNFLVTMVDKDRDEDEEEDKQRLTDIYNGTLGYIHSVIVSSKTLLIQFEDIDGLVAVNQQGADKIDLAYATTCHKAQGSGIPDVIAAMDYSSYKLLSRQLLYTMVSRASRKGVLLVETNAMVAAINNDASSNRRTFLADIIRQVNEIEKEHKIELENGL